jgi:5-methylcytosine-specific restriction endonuclease McrA
MRRNKKIKPNKILSHNVLVLNRSWIPMHITTVRDAIGLVKVGGAKIIASDVILDSQDRIAAHEFQTMDYESWTTISERLNPEEYDILKSAKFSHFKPSVIVRETDQRMRYEIKFCRSSLYERDNGRCQYCSEKLARAKSTVDHVHPKSKGGTNTWNNTVIACKPCNERKGDRTPEQANMPLLKPPGRPTWVKVKFGKAKTLTERKEWSKFTGSVESGIEDK